MTIHDRIQIFAVNLMDLSSLVAGLGNTVGSLIPYTCPHCGETRPISEYDGNIVDGSAECPSCNKDPSPWATRTELKATEQSDSHDQSSDTDKVKDRDYDDYEVENRFLSRIEWQEDSDKKTVQIYDESAHQWQKIGEQLGLQHGKLVSIRRDYHSDGERVRAVLGEWYDNANNLGNCHSYPKTWSGLIALLNNSDLGTLASKVNRALSASRSSIHGNMI